MTSLTFYYQACPVCGRSLRIPVQYFGKVMSCSHCGGEFQAIAAESRSIASGGIASAALGSSAIAQSELDAAYPENAGRMAAVPAVDGAN